MCWCDSDIKTKQVFLSSASLRMMWIEVVYPTHCDDEAVAMNGAPELSAEIYGATN